MISATVSLPTTITPVVDGAVTTTLTPASSSEGFSNALTAQLNLLTQPVETIDSATLTTTSANFSAEIAASTITPSPITTALLANTIASETAGASIQQPVIIPTDSPVVTSDATSNSSPILNTTMMSAEDTAILSAVTETLKFTTSGTKLGDTLPDGQTVKLPISNVATPLTQQNIQAAVKQAVSNTQVNTPASVLAQQIAPVSMIQGDKAPEVTSQIVVTSQAQMIEQVASTQPQTATNRQPASVNVSSTLEQIQVQASANPQLTDTNTLQITKQTQAFVDSQTADMDMSSQTTDINTSLTPAQTQAQAQAQASIKSQSANVSASLTPAQTQPNVNAQNANVNAAPTPVQAQTQIPVNSQTVNVNTAQASVQTQLSDISDGNVSVQTQSTVSDTLLTAQASFESVQQPSAQTPTLEQPVISQNAATTSDVKQPVVAEQISQDDVVVQIQQNTVPKTINQTPVTVDNSTASQLAVTTAPLLSAEQNSDVKTKNSNNSTPLVTADAERKTLENQDTLPVQVLPDSSVAPQVNTQILPPVQVQAKTENVSFDTTSDSITQDKPTLTSAKTLLMEAVANRNSGGDTSNNGGNGNNNAPSNPALQGDALLNPQTDNKQNADTKTFASLLNTDTTDTPSTTASSTTPITDKSTPQSVSAAVNKLVQDTKADVPAMTKPLSHPEWNQDLGERIVWMNNKGVSSAEIKMNPPNMGPISVRIDMNQDQATIAFTAQNTDVRNALEASVPKLREMLSSQNVNLAEVNVSQQSSTGTDSGRSQQQFAQMADASANSGQGNRQNNPELLDAQGNPINVGNGIDGTVDEFANGQVISSNGTNGLLSIYA